MAQAPVINSFNAGELSPYMYARNDLSKYNSGCLTLENFQVLPYGGVTRRPAIKYIAESKNNGKVRLISFEFSSAQTYVLELGATYVRFYKNTAQLVNAYTAWLTSTSYLIGDLVTDGGSNYRCLVAHSSGTFATDLAANKWVLSAGATDLAYEIVSPWAVADVYDIKFVQSADIMWLVHPDYPIQKLSRTSDTVWTLEEMTPDFPALLEQNVTATTITPSGTTGSVTLTASTDTFDANHVGAYWEIKHARTDNTITTFDQTSGSAPNPAVPTSLTNAMTGVGDYSLLTKGTYTSTYIAVWRSTDEGVTWERFRNYNMDGRNIDKSWDETKTGVYYAVTATSGTIGTFDLFVSDYYVKGIAKITAYASAVSVTATVIDELGSATATTKWTEGAWSDYRGFPQACSIWESRTCFAGTLSNPNTLWFSQIDDFQNFLTGSNDSDAIKATIGSGRIDEIRWLVPQKALVIGTVGSEWVMEAESDNKPITPSSFALRRKTTYGSGKNQAILVNSAVLFIMRQGRKVREFTYRFDVDAYVAPDLTMLSEHITTGGVTNTAYQQQPDSVLIAIRADGTMIPMTYERDQEVTSWYRYTMNGGAGSFESVAVIPRDADEDQVWTSCKLTVNSVTKRYIGVFDNREWGTNVATEWNGSDFYKVYDSLDQDGWLTVAAKNSSDSDFNQDYLYSVGTWTGVTDSGITMTKATDWSITDGVITYSEKDNGLTIPPKRLVLNSESSNASVSGLLGSVQWYDTGTLVNSKILYYDFSDIYARWWDGSYWIVSIIADVDGSPTDFYKLQPWPNVITSSGAGTFFLNDVWTREDGDDAWWRPDRVWKLYYSSGQWSFKWAPDPVVGSPVTQGTYHATTTDSVKPPKTGWEVSDYEPEGAEADEPPPTLTYIDLPMFDGYGSWTGQLDWEEDPSLYLVNSTNALTGLDYLEGLTVDIVRDGMAEPQQVVSGGSITTPAGERIVVGIPYTSTMAPIYIEPPSQYAQPMGKKKGLFKAVLRFKDTLSAKVGQSLDSLYPAIFRGTGDVLDGQVAMFSGEKKISFDNEYKDLHTCYIHQDKPLPITVVAMIPEVEVKG